MKKIALIALVFVLVLSLTACGRKNSDNTTDNNQNSSTDLPIVPDVTPDTGTNIPDPEVNGNSTTDNNNTDLMPDGNSDTSNNMTGTDNSTTNNSTTNNSTTSNN